MHRPRISHPPKPASDFHPRSTVVPTLEGRYCPWKVGSSLPGSQARISVNAAIVVELVHDLGVVKVRVTAASVTVPIAGDGGPVRPRRSPAFGRADRRRQQADGPARRRRRPRLRSRSQVAGRMPALRPARPAGGPPRAEPGRRGGVAGGPRRPDRPGRHSGRLRAEG